MKDESSSGDVQILDFEYSTRLKAKGEGITAQIALVQTEPGGTPALPGTTLNRFKRLPMKGDIVHPQVIRGQSISLQPCTNRRCS